MCTKDEPDLGPLKTWRLSTVHLLSFSRCILLTLSSATSRILLAHNCRIKVVNSLQVASIAEASKVNPRWFFLNVIVTVSCWHEKTSRSTIEIPLCRVEFSSAPSVLGALLLPKLCPKKRRRAFFVHRVLLRGIYYWQAMFNHKTMKNQRWKRTLVHVK